MNTIERADLRSLLENRADARVVMVLGQHRFAQAHIPGSETFADLDEALASLRPDEDIVVYCSGASCSASARAAHVLTNRGYQRVRRYVGGLEDWHAAGLPLAGDAAVVRQHDSLEVAA